MKGIMICDYVAGERKSFVLVWAFHLKFFKIFLFIEPPIGNLFHFHFIFCKAHLTILMEVPVTAMTISPVDWESVKLPLPDCRLQSTSVSPIVGPLIKLLRICADTIGFLPLT